MDSALADPLVDVGCTVCRAETHQVVCTARELKAQLRFLRRFHARRLRRGPRHEELSDRSDFTQDYATDVVSCRSCRHVYRSPRPRTVRIIRAYTDDHYGSDRLEKLFGAQLELYRRKIPLLRRHLATLARPFIVEVGSFVGGFLAAARDAGWDAIGVDPGREVGRFCAARGLRVIGSTLGDAALEPRSADGVAIWNTFDQLPRPEPTLEAARRVLRPGGIVAVRVPNGACFRHHMDALRGKRPHPRRRLRLAALAWNNLLGFPYLNGYSPATLDRVFASHGFTRVAARADVLSRLADADTKRWAAWEERLVKLAWRGSLRWHEFWRIGASPWFDAVYRCTSR